MRRCVCGPAAIWFCAGAFQRMQPPVFGVIANHISTALLPLYLLLILVLMIFAHEKMLKKVK